MDALKLVVVNTALQNMLKKGYLDICTIKKVNEISGKVPHGESLQLLEALHCVHFQDMPQELLRGLPLLIQRAIGSESLEFDYKEFSTHLRIAS